MAARRNLGKITVGAGIPNMFRIWMIGVFSVFQWCLVTKWPPFVLFSNGPYHWKTELLASLDHFYKKENNFKTFCIPMFGIQARMIYNIQLVIQAMTWKMENSNTKPVCHPNPHCFIVIYVLSQYFSVQFDLSLLSFLGTQGPTKEKTNGHVKQLFNTLNVTTKPWIWESDFSLLGLCIWGCLTLSSLALYYSNEKPRVGIFALN